MYANGVVYYGDEKRPDDGNPGGSYFKFIPATFAIRTPAPITNLAASPLTAGTVYVLQVGVRPTTDYGFGTSTGLGKWVEVDNSRVVPEPRRRRGSPQAHRLLPAGRRSTSTGAPSPPVTFGSVATTPATRVQRQPPDQGHTYGETVCITDGTLAQAATPAGARGAVPRHRQPAALDDGQHRLPARPGNWIIHEDGEERTGNNDLWDCADDGQDDDLLSRRLYPHRDSE